MKNWQRSIATTLGWLTICTMCMGFECEVRESGLVLPDDAVEMTAPDGTEIVETGYENPILRGFFPVDLSVVELTRNNSASPLYDEEETYTGPTAPRFSVAGAEEFGWLDIAMGGLDLSADFRALGPNISLPMGGAPVSVVMDTATFSSSAAEGFTREPLDSRNYSLRPSVLVIPVDVTVFAAVDGTLPYVAPDETTVSAIVSQIFDPTGSFATALSAASDLSINAFELAAFLEVRPDELWYQCGIQFHLDSVEVIPQDDGLETDLVASTAPCMSFTAPLTSYIPPSFGADAIPVFVGGEIRATLLDEYFGITCPPGSPNEFIAIEGGELLTSGILAHELGHYVGLDHETAPANLMTPPTAAGIAGVELDESQCALARCDAATLLRRFGRIDTAREDEECAPFRAMCGDGVTELGERCDDGNDVDGDGCRADCTEELCGDGIMDPGEPCDYRLDPDNCSFACEVCVGCTVCGDGVLQPGEDCDPPDAMNNCNVDCTFIIF